MEAENSFRPRFTRVKGISDRRRLPRLGKIRLGLKKVSQKSGKEYPTETDYFVCPPEVQEVYGEQPKELDVMFPVNDPDTVFPQAYKWYGSTSGIKCIGDGEIAMRAVEGSGELRQMECPCEMLETRDCSLRAHLLVILPKVNLSGIYQIDTGSISSIIDINSGMDYVRAILGGRMAMIPLVLKRVPREMVSEGKKRIHYTLQLLPAFTGLPQIQGYRDGICDHNLLPPPVLEVDPKNDGLPPDIVASPEEEAADRSRAAGEPVAFEADIGPYSMSPALKGVLAGKIGQKNLYQYQAEIEEFVTSVVENHPTPIRGADVEEDAIGRIEEFIAAFKKWFEKKKKERSNGNGYVPIYDRDHKDVIEEIKALKESGLRNWEEEHRAELPQCTMLVRGFFAEKWKRIVKKDYTGDQY